MGPLSLTIQLAMAATVIGLATRGRWRLCRSFVPYLAAGLTIWFLVSVWPERFWTQRVFMGFQAVADLLKLAIALEIAWRTFRLFPGAATAARGVGLAILAFTAVVSLSALVTAPDPDPYVVAITLVTPRVQNGILWLMAATLVVSLWYRVPVHPFHVGLLTSFVAYQAFYLALLSLMAYGFNERREISGLLDGVAYQLAATWWAYTAWKPESTIAAAHVDMLRRVQLGLMVRAS